MRIKAYVNTAGLIVAAAAVAGCGSLGRDPVTVGSVPSDYRTAHPIVLSEQERTLDVPIASGARELGVPVRSNIRAFASEFADAGTGVLFVIMPKGSPNEQAAGALQSDIVKAITEAGAKRSRIVVQHYDASQYGSAAAVRLSYNGIVAATNKCGQWPADIANNSENTNYHDFGCSSQANLAAIVANPGDLMGPRESSAIDATERAAVIGAYQKGPKGGGSEVSY